MKKTLISVAFATIAFAQVANAQTNLQLFYDFGGDRKCITTTLEMFKGDNWGNTFFFVDYNYHLNSNNGSVDSPSETYFEIARCLNFWQNSALKNLSVQVEYNGGFGEWVAPGATGFYGVNHAGLVGLDYFIHSKNFNNCLNLKVLYKKFKNLDQKAPVQFTAVWGLQDLFGLKGLRFSGFADVWWEGKCVFLSEPQLWYGFGEHFNIGGEIELSSNFAGAEGFKCRPCLGFKWNF